MPSLTLGGTIGGTIEFSSLQSDFGSLEMGGVFPMRLKIAATRVETGQIRIVATIDARCIARQDVIAVDR